MMNPYALNNTARLKYFAEAILESVRVAEHNSLVEQRIEKEGDRDGHLHKQYEKPRFWINNMFVLAQITDDEDDLLGEETYNIKEGGAVLFQEDGAKNESSIVRDLPPVMFL
ncbi:MAG: hypothetical protein KAT00_04740 [Planctomycetes bacterium]|nr:hypothetical protein [Planctomycetota bacterium]